MSEPDSDPTPQLVRIGEHSYRLVKRRDGAGMELVRAVPDDVLAEDREVERRRAEVAAAYGGYRESPRRTPLANIDQPIAKRTETILSHEADAETRAALTGRLTAPRNRGRR